MTGLLFEFDLEMFTIDIGSPDEYLVRNRRAKNRNVTAANC
jgi:hypothetical protein